MSAKFLVYILCVLICLSSCKSKAKEVANAKQKAGTLKVNGLIVSPSYLDQKINISGTIIPFEETVLMPEISGRVVDINIPEGGFVKKGTLLVKLYDGELQAQLKKSLIQLKLANLTAQRQSELISVNGISQSEYDQSVLLVNSINADIEVLKVQIRKTEVYAPFDGALGLRNISIGAQVTPSTKLVTIRNVKQLKLDFNVPEKYSSEIKPGLLIRFSVQGIDTKFEAKVIASEQGINIDSRNMKARAVVLKLTELLTPGAFANVELRLNINNYAIMVPSQCIIPQEKLKKIIVCKNGKAKFINVKTGIRTSSEVEVTSGIYSGDTVVTSGVMFLKPNTVLNFSKITKREAL